MDSLFIFADQHNITFIGGSWRTVGAAGGWAQGGGHSVLTNTYGLGADRVVQFKVVTPDGLYRTANACQNKDLFWALRGGGGGTFVGTLHNDFLQSFSWSLTPTPENLRSFMTILVENAVRWSQEGWGGYVYTPAGIIANPLLNASQAAQSLKPITDFFKNVKNGAGGGAGSGAQGQWTEYSTFLPLFTAIVSGSANSSALVEAALEVITRSSGTASFYFATPFLYDVKKTQQGDSSVTPAWRDAVWHALVDIEWPWDGGAEQAKATYKKASYAMDPLRKLTPGGGAYQNEADVYEPDFAQSFWGSNYAKLLDIKHKYDPDGLLDCWHCGRFLA
ncbi:FAD binding domain-containing protein [Rhizoctonia solani AG-1 IA]|uniref:FAD binding domain-containing protein n=1 Tax=Thanatephorus cucumeris (strain AG1-IA) TaxID=983506 RepID=L8X2I0_THACA|nr:FAD binding domain-containing protein [Rhizoctonia solani AG-1 IA]